MSNCLGRSRDAAVLRLDWVASGWDGNGT